MRAFTQRFDPEHVDALIAVMLALDLILESVLTHGLPANGRLPTALVAVPFAATVAARRRHPGRALIACTALALLQQCLHGQLFSGLPSESAELGPILCAYGVGAWCPVRRSAGTTATAAALFYGMALVARYGSHVSGAPDWIGAVGILVVFLVAPWAVGVFVGERSRRLAAFGALERQALAERAERERAAVAQERITIGRELQDIIAHNVSVMVVQASGARRLLALDPDRARESMLTVEQTGREALAEMRRLLGLLRKDDDPRALAPQPGLDQLVELAATLRVGGLACELHEEGTATALTPGINLVGYRALEAALTAAADQGVRSASATVRYAPRELVLEIRGEGNGVALAPALASVSERVDLYGGTLEVADARHGFGVRCRLPLERVA